LRGDWFVLSFRGFSAGTLKGNLLLAFLSSLSTLSGFQAVLEHRWARSLPR
jgi:hypothetical protein